MSGAAGTPPTRPRVRVTSPRTGGIRRRRVTGATEIDAQSGIGEVYMTSLLRAQLRLATLVLLVLGLLLAGLPVVFATWPELVRVQVVGMPLPWVLLALAVYPFLLVLAWAYVRAAERNERDFADVVQRR
jgi:hypothetical protein